MRRVVALAAFAAALVVAPQAVAFPPGTCTGNACTGSTTDSFAGVPVCEPGTTTYWEDSYIPADVINPRLAKFTVTPDPPCTGARVSAPVPDPWPASNTDPDGKPAGKSEPGKAIFRFRWTVTVPQGSKTIGTMNVAWTLDWTKPGSGGGSTTATTTSGESGKYDLEVQLSAPDALKAAKAPQRFTIKMTVYNNGPAESPEINIYSRDAPRLHAAYLTIGGSAHAMTIVQRPEHCGGQNIAPQCSLDALAPGTSESYEFVVEYDTYDRTDVVAGKKQHERTTIETSAAVNWNGNRPSERCYRDETTCGNNHVSESILFK